ncbi:MAG: transcriptional regulator [Thermoprotei archaeon]|nr:MAG: transcriptional regulator [Thermoprotei archaeon]
MSEEITLKPISKRDVHRLETALMVATLLRPDVLEKIREPSERLTWLDSLAVAAGALARSRAGYTVMRIADELGRSEATIRNHIRGKTEAGRLVLETYERFVREGIKIELPTEVERRDKEIEELRIKLKSYEEKLLAIKRRLEEILAMI